MYAVNRQPHHIQTIAGQSINKMCTMLHKHASGELSKTLISLAKQMQRCAQKTVNLSMCNACSVRLINNMCRKLRKHASGKLSKTCVLLTKICKLMHLVNRQPEQMQTIALANQLPLCAESCTSMRAENCLKHLCCSQTKNANWCTQ